MQYIVLFFYKFHGHGNHYILYNTLICPENIQQHLQKNDIDIHKIEIANGKYFRVQKILI